jgi:glycosyltransferase involved in cell wall biosynthesis
MKKLISVIIPCFNAEKWIKEAIDSCLRQTYPTIEIIVIDDGSTDTSLEQIKSYGDRVIWETGPNRGGNYARNRGFALSKGDYIQYLDADDFLLPEKIERQVKFLEESNVDVVYGDWRYQYHHPNGKVNLDGIKISRAQPDVLESLLSGWWVSPACLLFRRAGQDRDFFTSVVMSGAKVGYQPGCYSIYRRYGNVTVSTASKTRYLENHLKILMKNEKVLSQRGLLNPVYKDALAQSYFIIARNYLYSDFSKYTELLKKVLELSPNFTAKSTERTVWYSLAQKILGFRYLEKLVALIKRLQIAILATSG